VRRRRGRVVAPATAQVPRVSWDLVTAPDERERCCVVVDGEHCAGRPTSRSAAPAASWTT